MSEEKKAVDPVIEPVVDEWFKEPAEKVEAEPAPVVEPGEKKEESKPEPKPIDKAEKRIADTQKRMHEETQRRRELEKQNEKLRAAFVAQAEANGAVLTEEDRELADVNPIEFAKVYAEKLIAAKESASKVGELTDAEKESLAAEAKAETDRLNEELAEEAILSIKELYPDFDEIVTMENSEMYLTGKDHKEIRECQTHAEKFKLGYEKLKAYIGGVAVAKEKMRKGEPVPTVPSLSEVGAADPNSPVGIEERIKKAWRDY